MLSRLRIENFQKHERLDVKLESINVFIGPSDAGKSAILRALRWLMTNKPGGVSFVRHGSESCAVRLKVGSKTIIRERGKENVYRLGKDEFKAFGADVPDTVAAVFNVDSLINFQDQHDAVFWFSESAAEVGRRLNAIVNLEVVDRVLSDGTNRLKKAKQENEVLRSQLKEAENTVDKLSCVPRLVKHWNRIEQLQNRMTELTEGVDYLTDLCSSLTDVDNKVKQGRAVSKSWEVVKTSKGVVEGLSDQIAKLKKLGQTIKETQAKAGLAVPDITPLEERRSVVRLKQQELARLKALVADTKSEESRIDQLTQNLAKAEKQLAVTAKDKRCPTCGQTLKS